MFGLIETEAQKIDRLEKIWSRTGRLRPITFKCRFYPDEMDPEYDHIKDVGEATRFGEENGFQSQQSYIDDGIALYFTKHIEPTLSEINKWAQIFKEKCSDGTAYFDGWSYPSPLKITFWPEKRAVDRRVNGETSVVRTRTIFDEVVLKDPLNRTSTEGFSLNPHVFLKRAKKLRPQNPQPTVSAFSQWVYSLYANHSGDEEDRERGKFTEQAVWALRRRAERSLDNNTLRSHLSGWNLIHNGLHLRDVSTHNHLLIPALAIGGAPLRASPDLAFKNRSSGEVIIVEIKSSFMEIPINLWLNIWAQLWCYSKIDFALAASKLTVVGEVWANHNIYIGRNNPISVVSLRASVRRDPRRPSFDRFFSGLFDIYRSGFAL